MPNHCNVVPVVFGFQIDELLGSFDDKLERGEYKDAAISITVSLGILLPNTRLHMPLHSRAPS